MFCIFFHYLKFKYNKLILINLIDLDQNLMKESITELKELIHISIN